MKTLLLMLLLGLPPQLPPPRDQPVPPAVPVEPFKVISNIYFVGPESEHSSFLITTPQGHILINTGFERQVPTIVQSIEKLGFKTSDIKIILGSHAHNDHQEGDAEMKRITGAQVMAMAEDVPALKAMKPGGKEHPIDKVFHDKETISLGGVTLTALLRPDTRRDAPRIHGKRRTPGRPTTWFLDAASVRADVLTRRTIRISSTISRKPTRLARLCMPMCSSAHMATTGG